MKCRRLYGAGFIASSEDAPKCSCGAAVKPDVVLYGETLDLNVLDESVNLIRDSDLLVVGGTSLVVNPAASLLKYFSGKNLIIINKTKTPSDRYASIVINESIGQVLDSVL
jgi:NAD-dependent deacetylase